MTHPAPLVLNCVLVLCVSAHVHVYTLHHVDFKGSESEADILHLFCSPPFHMSSPSFFSTLLAAVLLSLFLHGKISLPFMYHDGRLRFSSELIFVFTSHSMLFGTCLPLFVFHDESEAVYFSDLLFQFFRPPPIFSSPASLLKVSPWMQLTVWCDVAS